MVVGRFHEELAIIGGLAIIFVVIVLFNFTEGRLFEIMIGEFEEFFGMIADDDFLTFALTIEILWELLPQTAQILGLGAITVRLLSSGINPFILGIITATARLGGQIILYFVGRFIAKFFIKNTRREASAMHFMHKYHFIVFLFPAWLGAFGDFIMLTAGHQKINLFKIIPVLFIGNLADAYKWIFYDLGQIGLVESFE